MNQMSRLRIIKEGNEYIFLAEGCYLTYFVIWEGEREPTIEDWELLKQNGEYKYCSTRNFDGTKGIHFHVYCGNNSKDFRGKTYRPPDRHNNPVRSVNMENNSNGRDRYYNGYHQMEMMNRCLNGQEMLMRRKMDEFKEEIKEHYEKEIQKVKEEKKELEDKKQKMEDERRRKEEERIENINYVNKEVKKIPANILKNFQIKVSEKGINKLYMEYKLFDTCCMIPKNYIKDYIKINIQNISNVIVKDMLIESKHFNIILIGKTGVGKSTLINSVLKLTDDKKAKEGFGLSTTKKYTEYISNKRKGLRLIDSRGIEIGKHNINEVINDVIIYIENIAKEGNPDKFIHCIWYCIESNCSRVEKEEENAMKELNNIYEEKGLPVIFVLTKSYNEEEYDKMVKYLEGLGIKDIITVLAKEYNFKINGKNIKFPIKNVKKLIKLSFEKSKNSGYPSFKKSLNEKILDKILIDTSKIYNNNLTNGLNSNMNYYNSETLIKSIKDKLNQIIDEYTEEQYNNYKYNNFIKNNKINQRINTFVENLYNLKEVKDIINSNKSQFYNEYKSIENSILFKYGIYMYNINFRINNNIYGIIEQKVINEIIRILSSKIYSDFNLAIGNFIYEEINNIKKTKISLNIPEYIIFSIQRNSDNIYKKLENISDEENEQDEKIKNTQSNKKKSGK